MILISACLCGDRCRYDGRNNLIEVCRELYLQNKAVTACPEVLGGLPVPRPPCEINNADGYAVLKKEAQVITVDGKDCSEAFIKGAKLTLAFAQKHRVSLAILKSRSPSCGAGSIYDGTFSKTLIPGFGVAAALLNANHIKVITEEDFILHKEIFLS